MVGRRRTGDATPRAAAVATPLVVVVFVVCVHVQAMYRQLHVLNNNSVSMGVNRGGRGTSRSEFGVDYAVPNIFQNAVRIHQNTPFQAKNLTSFFWRGDPSPLLDPSAADPTPRPQPSRLEPPLRSAYPHNSS